MKKNTKVEKCDGKMNMQQLTNKLLRNLKFSILFVALMLPATIAQAQSSRSASLSYDWRGALANALKTDENVLAHQQKLKQAQKAQKVSISYEAVPRMLLSGEGGGAFAKVDKNNDTEKNTSSFSPYLDVALEVEQKIADGGERKAELREKRIAVAIARATLRNAEQKSITQALKRYIDLRYRALLYRAQQREQMIRQQNLKIASKNDTIPVWEKWNIQQDAQQGQNALLESRKNLDISRGNFVATFRFLPKIDELTRVDLPLELIPRTFEESLQIAQRANPAYLVETQKAQNSTNEILKARSKGLPKISMVAEGRYRYNPLPERFHDQSNQELLAYAGLRINWQLADTFRLRGLVKTARAGANVAERERGLFASKHREKIAEIWNNLVSLSAQYTAQQNFGRNNAILISSMREAVNKGLEGGKLENDNITSTRAVELEAQFIKTQVQFLNTERELISAYVDLLGEIGLLDRATLNI